MASWRSLPADSIPKISLQPPRQLSKNHQVLCNPHYLQRIHCQDQGHLFDLWSSDSKLLTNGPVCLLTTIMSRTTSTCSQSACRSCHGQEPFDNHACSTPKSITVTLPSMRRTEKSDCSSGHLQHSKAVLISVHMLQKHRKGPKSTKMF